MPTIWMLRRRATLALVGLMLGASGGLVVAGGPAGAQTPSTVSDAGRCSKVRPAAVFVGRIRSILEDVVTFDVSRVRSGDVEPGTPVDVQYPNQFNARKLIDGDAYLVSATKAGSQLVSLVPTAQLTACAQSTRQADGSPIDTATLAGARDQFPKLARSVGLVVLALLVGLVLLGRFFDRRSRYL